MNIKTIGFNIRPNSPNLRDYYIENAQKLHELGIETLLSHFSADIISLEGVNAQEVFERSDLLVSVGGDGTLISLARRSLMFQKPILGVNLGRLGFLTDIYASKLIQRIQEIMNGDYQIAKRMVIEAFIEGEDKKHYAINDIAIKNASNKVIRLKLFIDDFLVNNYYGDGLLIATPTGSTGYNLSCGGAIVYPYAKNLIFTPICPHSLTQRSFVLPVNFDVSLMNDDQNGVIIIDGQEQIPFTQNDTLKIRMSDYYAHMVHRKERNFFKIINEKLQWGDNGN